MKREDLINSAFAKVMKLRKEYEDAKAELFEQMSKDLGKVLIVDFNEIKDIIKK